MQKGEIYKVVWPYAICADGGHAVFYYVTRFDHWWLGIPLMKDGAVTGIEVAVFDLPNTEVIPILVYGECPSCSKSAKIQIYDDYLCRECRKALVAS